MQIRLHIIKYLVIQLKLFSTNYTTIFHPSRNLLITSVCSRRQQHESILFEIHIVGNIELYSRYQLLLLFKPIINYLKLFFDHLIIMHLFVYLLNLLLPLLIKHLFHLHLIFSRVLLLQLDKNRVILYLMTNRLNTNDPCRPQLVDPHFNHFTTQLLFQRFLINLDLLI